MKHLLLLGLGSSLLAACAVNPPANWARGGSVLEIPRARWVRGDVAVEIAQDGRVMVNGEHQLTIDRGGRVYDPDARPVALIEPDGRLVGPNDKPLGNVGVWSASLPGEDTAWLSLLPSGEVVRYGDEGVRSSMGAWVGGCSASPSAHLSCVVVTHLLGMKLREQRPYSPGFGSPYGPTMTPGLGVGIGIGIGL